MDDISYIISPIKADLDEFNKVFDQTLQTEDPQLEAVFKVLVQSKGKLMRPILLLLVAKELGVPGQSSYFSAATLELLHTASLVHDDVVDESDERRGHASINALFGNKVAVLIGDYLLSNSLMKATETLSVKIINRVCRLGRELSGGELLQLHNSAAEDFSEDAYYSIIKQKTAALFTASAELGALSVDASEEVVGRMKTLGETIGICFQIRDDIFDYYSDSNVGKPTGNDFAEGKLTLPILHVINNKPTDRLLELAKKVKAGTVSKAEILELVDFAVKGGGIEYAKNRMQSLVNEAKAIAGGFRNADVRSALVRYVDFVASRTL